MRRDLRPGRAASSEPLGAALPAASAAAPAPAKAGGTAQRGPSNEGLQERAPLVVGPSRWPCAYSRSNARKVTGDGVCQRRHLAGPVTVHALLEQAEVGPSGLVQGDELAVEHQPGAAERLG